MTDQLLAQLFERYGIADEHETTGTDSMQPPQEFTEEIARTSGR